MLGSDLYSSASNSVSEIILRKRMAGHYRVSTNNLSFGAQSSFFIAQGSIMNALVLSGSVVLPIASRAPDLWALHAIDTVELNISGSSSVQSLKISGRSMLDYLLCSCHSSKVQALKASNPFIHLKTGGATVKFSIPLHLFFSSPEISSVFSLDTSTLNAQIIVNINWKQAWNVFSGDVATAITVPTAFATLNMSVVAQNQISNNFALSTELRKDSELVYSIPGTYLQTFQEIQTVSTTGIGVPENSIAVTSQPSGMLQMILLSIQPMAYIGAVGTQTLILPWAQIETLRVNYNGDDIIKWESKEEGRLYNCIYTDRDNGMDVKLRNHYTNAVSATDTVVELDTVPVYIIPFGNEISNILRERRSEHTKNFSGSTINVYYTLSAEIAKYSDTLPISGTNQAAGSLVQASGSYRVNLTYVNSALYEINSSTVSMSM
jgi:hypothetical protein